MLGANLLTARRSVKTGPTTRYSRRRQPRFCEVFHHSTPWRSINAASAARLSVSVGRQYKTS